MAINLSDNIKINSPKILDDRYGPWSSISEANSNILFFQRQIGLTVGILSGTSLTEYWYSSGITDTDLVVKTTNISGKLNISDFNIYSSTTQNIINTKLNIIDFNIYSGYTLNNINNNFNQFTAFTNSFNSYSANTLNTINTKLNISDFNIYSSTTQNIINNNYSQFTGFTSSFNIYSANTFNTLNSKYDKTGGTISGSVIISPSLNTTPLTITNYTATTSTSPALDIGGYWNLSPGPTPPPLLRLSVNDISSSGSGLLIDCKYNNSSIFSLNRFAEIINPIISTKVGGVSVPSEHGLTVYGTEISTSGSGGGIRINRNLSTSSGGGLFNGLTISSNINQTGSASGTTRGILIQPSLTSAPDWRAIESTNGRWVLTDTYSSGSGVLDNPSLDINTTWSTSGTPTLIRTNLTDTSSDTNSLFLDFRRNSTSQLRVTKNGDVYARGSLLMGGNITPGTGMRQVNPSNGSATLGTIFDVGLNFLDFRNPLNSGYSYWFRSAQYAGLQYSSGTGGYITIERDFIPTVGDGTFNVVNLNNVINQMSGASGTTRGIYINPTLTSAFSWRSIEWSNNSGFGLYGAGSANNVLLGNTGVGLLTTPSAKLHIRGAGATSSTTALQVENSASELLYSVRNDGLFLLGNDTQRTFLYTGAQGAFGSQALNGDLTLYVSSNRTTSGPLPNGVLGITKEMSETHTTGTVNYLRIGYKSGLSFNPITGSGIVNYLNITPVLNQTTGATGTIRGFYYNPTITSVNGQHNAIETTSGDIIINGGNVGIGTSIPTQRLDVNGSTRFRGSIYDLNNSTGLTNYTLITTPNGVVWVDASAIISGSSGTIIQLGSGLGSTLRIGNGNVSSGIFSGVLSGSGNTISATANCSFIGGGCGNLILSGSSMVSGGNLNTVSNCYTFIGGGQRNTVTGLYSGINGGFRNQLTSGRYSIIGNGFCNSISGSYGVIAGGQSNLLTSSDSFIGSGYKNTTSGRGSVVGGGWCNTISQNFSTIGGGVANTISGTYGVISGGWCNTVLSTQTIIGAGFQNIGGGCYSFIGAGIRNRTIGCSSLIGGGLCNTTFGTFSVVGGGFFNNISGTTSSIINGTGNTIGSQLSLIGGGRNNTTLFDNTFIFGSNITANATDTTFTQNFNSCGQSTLQGISSTTGCALLVRNSTPLNLLTIQNNGQQIIDGNFTATANNSVGTLNCQIINQRSTQGDSIIGTLISPTLRTTQNNQTNRGFSVYPAFTASTFTWTGTTNIIADFGALNVGTQLSVTDATTGVIYGVNDISGLPIIDATSNWDVNIYDFPNTVLSKTGKTLTFGVANNSASTNTFQSDIIFDERIGLNYRLTQVSGVTTGSSSNVLFSTFVNSGQTIMMEAKVSGRANNVNMDTIIGEYKYSAKRSLSGNLTQVGSIFSFINKDNLSTNFAIDISGNNLRLIVTGNTDTYIWGSTITTQTF